MSTAVRQLLASFEALPDADKREASLEILRRTGFLDGDLPDTALVEAADDLFQKLDSEEAENRNGRDPA